MPAPVAKIECPGCGWIRCIWSWDASERDRVWEWLRLHNKGCHYAV